MAGLDLMDQGTRGRIDRVPEGFTTGEGGGVLGFKQVGGCVGDTGRAGGHWVTGVGSLQLMAAYYCL